MPDYPSATLFAKLLGVENEACTNESDYYNYLIHYDLYLNLNHREILRLPGFEPERLVRVHLASACEQGYPKAVLAKIGHIIKAELGYKGPFAPDEYKKLLGVFSWDSKGKCALQLHLRHEEITGVAIENFNFVEYITQCGSAKECLFYLTRNIGGLHENPDLHGAALHLCFILLKQFHNGAVEYIEKYSAEHYEKPNFLQLYRNADFLTLAKCRRIEESVKANESSGYRVIIKRAYGYFQNLCASVGGASFKKSTKRKASEIEGRRRSTVRLFAKRRKTGKETEVSVTKSFSA